MPSEGVPCSPGFLKERSKIVEIDVLRKRKVLFCGHVFDAPGRNLLLLSFASSDPPIWIPLRKLMKDLLVRSEVRPHAASHGLTRSRQTRDCPATTPSERPSQLPVG